MENISSKRLVDISSLMEYLSLGRNSALKFGEESGAKLKVGRRTLALWFALLFVSGGAAIGTTIVSKKEKYSVK